MDYLRKPCFLFLIDLHLRARQSEESKCPPSLLGNLFLLRTAFLFVWEPGLAAPASTWRNDEFDWTARSTFPASLLSEFIIFLILKLPCRDRLSKSDEGKEPVIWTTRYLNRTRRCPDCIVQQLSVNGSLWISKPLGKSCNKRQEILGSHMVVHVSCVSSVEIYVVALQSKSTFEHANRVLVQ